MYLECAIFLAVAAIAELVFYVLRLKKPPPTIDVVFLVRVFMQNGRWGIAMQSYKWYFRLPMLFDVDERMDFGCRPSLVHDFVSESGRRTRLAIFSVMDELSYPLMMPSQGVRPVNALEVVDWTVNIHPNLSTTARDIMFRAQERVWLLTRKPGFEWFTGK
jgi:hypothetical protein